MTVHAERPAVATPGAPVEAALRRALAALTRAQQGDHWAGELSSSALATAMATSALHLVDEDVHAQAIAKGRAWLVRTQHTDGGWGDAVVDPSNINATSLSIAALALTEAEAKPGGSDDEHVRCALRCLEQHFGGFAAVGDPARCTLSGPSRTLAALAGFMDWATIKRLRPEVVLLPSRLRRTISTTFPAYLSIATLHSARAPHVLNSFPTYKAAIAKSLNWLARAQGPNGSFEESAFLTSVIVACLVAAGHRQLPWLRPAIDFVSRGQRQDGSWPIDRDLETFDTDLAVSAYTEAGVEVPASQHVAGWLLRQQTTESCFATGAPPGGWPWAMPAGWPDTDDTAYSMLALRALGVAPVCASIRSGARWLAWMQDRSGSWSTFVRGSRMPFDHDCPYVTGHVLSALQATDGFQSSRRRFDRALAYLARAQRPDGGFASIWFREKTAGTASVLQALCDIGLCQSSMARRARQALLSNQNQDGGWGGVCGEASSAEETAWAVLALLADHSTQSGGSVQSGVDWLVEHQLADGTWRPWPIGLYYSAMWYSDSMYALALPAQALARARKRSVAGCVSA